MKINLRRILFLTVLIFCFKSGLGCVIACVDCVDCVDTSKGVAGTTRKEMG